MKDVISILIIISYVGQLAALGQLSSPQFVYTALLCVHQLDLR